MRTNCNNKKLIYRQRIIDALEEQALEKGFHKASMSEVAKSADLSVGQIYRYFAHKDDIICALVEQTTERHLKFMSDFLNKTNWLSRHFSNEDLDQHAMRTLHAEIQAEAARNKVIYHLNQESHQRLRDRAFELMQEKYPLMHKDEIIARIEMLITLTEGLLARWDYQSRPFSQATIQLYDTILEKILP